MGNRWTPYPRDLVFGSHFIYPSSTSDQASRNIKSFLLNVKQDRYAGNPPRRLLPLAIEQVQKAFEQPGCRYRDFFGPSVMLVPAPGHALQLKNSLSTTRALCLELEARGMGRMVPCISRTKAVPKSAWSAPGERPTAQQHYETMTVDRAFEGPPDILIIDDIVTRGATLIAVAARLSESYPGIRIRGFGLARTMPALPPDGRKQDPVVGVISVIDNEARRWP